MHLNKRYPRKKYHFITNMNHYNLHLPITIILFETTNSFTPTMDLQVNEVLQTHGLNAKIIPYIKDENNNLSIMTIALTYNIVSYEVLGLIKPFI